MKTLKHLVLVRAAVAACALSIASAAAYAQQAQPTLPSMKFLTAPLVSPTAGQTHYGSGTTHSSSFTGVSGFEGRPPEIVELARALKNDPDLIYEFVRNHIDTEFAFGLRKGALGSLIDKSGTPFDQNVLFVETVRQAGFTARYKIGHVTVSGSTFANWTGVSDAQAACKMLAAAAIPAAINGSSPSDCSVSGAITSVTLLHIWSEVSIGGTYYAFDPSLKTRTTPSPRDLVAGSGFISGAATTAAETTVTTGTQSGVTYIKNVSSTGLDTYLQTRGTQLLNDLKANAFSSDTDAILGVTKVVPEYKPTNGWRNATAAGYSSTSGAITITGDIPDQYRTKLTVQFQTSGTADLRINRLLYTDETYGRRLEIDTNFDQAHAINTPPTYAGGWSVSLEIDDVELQTYSSGLINGAGGPLTLIMDHPYAANSGVYADQTITKNVATRIPVAIVAGFGRVSPALQAKWSNERAQDEVLPVGGSPAYPCYSGEGMCSNNYASTAGDMSRQRVAAGWLAQLTRMVDLQTAISSTRAEHHHSLGVVAARHRFTGWVQDPEHTTGPVLYGINDNFTVINIDTSLSVTSIVNNAAKVKAVSRAVALAAATLEGSLLEQTEDLADASSTAARFAWGNTPDDEDPCGTGARRFYDYTGTSSETRAGLFTYEGSATGCAAGPDFLNYQDSALAPFWKGQLESALNAYLTTGGYNVTSSAETFMGPGSRFGMPHVIAQCHESGCHYYEKHDLTRQRGGAIVATKADGTGNILEVAHVLSDNSGQISKGGAGKEPESGATFDPNKAADILKDRFVDRSSALGVDLKSGTAGYTTPTLLSVGNGEAPFSLDYKLLFKAGASGCSPSGPCTGAMQGGWTHNWDIRFSTSGSGLEALGQTNPQAASGTIVGFLVMQDIFAQSGLSELKKDVYAALAADWWRRQTLGNVATVTQGFSGQQYVRLVDNTWVAPVGSPGTLTQTGQRAKVRDICRAAGPVNIDQRSVSRRWDHMNVGFTLTEGNGQVLSFAPWKWNWGDDHPCLLSYGYKITSWTWPQGPSLTFTTDTAGAVTAIATNAGRTLTVTPPTTELNASASGLSAARSSSTNIITDASGATWKILTTPVQGRSATQRPVPYGQLYRVFEPVALDKPALEYTYDSRGLVKEAKDAMALQWYPRRAHQFFIAEGSRAERQDPQGATPAEDGRFAVYYDLDGNPVRYIDEIGRENNAAYDGRNRVVERTMPEGDKGQFEYDERDNITKLTLIAKPSSCTPACPPSQVIEAAWHTNWNQPLWIKDQLGRQTDFTYFDTGNGKSLLATALRPAVGGTRPTYTFTYDALGRALTATDPSGLVTQNAYDGTNGMPISTVVNPGELNLTTAIAFDSVGNAITITDPRGNATTTQFDNLGRKTAEQDRNGGATGTILARSRLTLDALGRVTKKERALTLDASGNGLTWAATETVYTPTGKPVRVTDADGRVTHFAYDGIDRLIRATDPEGRVTGKVYDLASQVLKEQRALGTPIAQDYAVYTYTLNGQRLSVNDAKNNQTSYTYDGFDRPKRVTFPDATYEELGYDAIGNVVSKLTRGGQLIQNTYDTLDRVVTRLVPQPGGNPAILTVTAYDLAGRTTQISDDAGHILAHAFDTAKRLQSVTQTAPGGAGTRTVAYQLDATGNKTRATWADGYYVQYAFDALGRMTTATENGTYLLATYVWDPLSRRMNLVYGNGASQSYTYSTHGDLTSLGHTLTGTSATYTNTFTKSHQLASEQVSNTTWQYVPSAFQTTAYSAANNLNQYVNITVGANPAVTMTYDANGNLTTDGTWTFAYDAQNILRAANKSGTSASYAYDPLGRRQAKVVNGVNTTFLLDGDEEIAEYDGGNNLLRRFVPGPGTDQPIAMVTPSGGSSTRTYFHANRQGSVVATSADNGTIAEGPYTYDANGNGAPVGGVPFKYTGRRLDPETGLYYYRARYYSSVLGRFLQVDPVGYEDQMNLYAYVGNDPANQTDPTGKCTGSRITNDDGTCKSTGGWTTGSAGDVQGALKERQNSVSLYSGARPGGPSWRPPIGPSLGARQTPHIPWGWKPNQWGNFLRWGRGQKESAERLDAIRQNPAKVASEFWRQVRPQDAAEVKQAIRQWEQFYREVYRRNPKNETARNRAEYLKHLNSHAPGGPPASVCDDECT